MRPYYLIFVLVLSCTAAYAYVTPPYTTVADGNWSDAATWDEYGIPPNDGSAQVRITTNVTFDAPVTIRSIEILLGGMLTLHADLRVLENISTETPINPQTNAIILSGPADQWLGGMAAEVFYDLVINKPGGVVRMDFGKMITVTHTLTLTSGNIVVDPIGSANLFTLGAGATVADAGPESFIDGQLKRVGNGDGTMSFPIGKNGVYRPITLKNLAGSADLELIAEMFNTDTWGVAGGGMDALSTVRYWTMFINTGHLTSVRLSFPYDADDNVTDAATLRVGMYNDMSPNGTYTAIGARGSGVPAGSITTDLVTTIGDGYRPSNFVLGTASARMVAYVTPSGAGSKDGSSWANAFDKTQLQDAISGAGATEVWVAAGTYTPQGDRTTSFYLNPGVAVYGGFAGTESSLEERSVLNNPTILSGDLAGDDIPLNFTLKRTDNCLHVVTGAGADLSSVFDGFTIRGGYASATGTAAKLGGGMTCSGSPVIRNCTFTDNYAANAGGGLYSSGSPIIVNCLFTQNTAELSGGGISIQPEVEVPVVNITNCTIAGNWRGGLQSVDATTSVNNSIVWGNTGAAAGNQIAMTNGNVELNYTCYSNGTNDVSGEVTATNHNITTDPQFVGAGGYQLLVTSPCLDAGSDVYNIQSTDLRGTGFARRLVKTDGSVAGVIDMGAYEYVQGTDGMPVELSDFSASSLKGEVSLVWKTQTEANNYGFDIERKADAGIWTKVGFVSGHGTSSAPQAYQFSDKPGAGAFAYRLKQIDRDGKFAYSSAVEVRSLALPVRFGLTQNFPNPFNPSTTIAFALTQTEWASLELYNMLGQRVRTLFDGVAEGGVNHQVTLDASGLSSGAYFYRLSTPTRREMRRLQVVK